jgi:nicotinate phosphoribosyltransferase
MNGIPDETDININRWEEKYRKFDDMKLAVIEFGTRRRKSKAVQEAVIGTFIRTAPAVLKGTSNVMFAIQKGIPLVGTQAHEWYMFHAALHGVEHANTKALEKWVETYHGALGIALTDTYTTDDFFSHFNTYYSRLFDGLRQDSGDPVVFAGKAINHYLGKSIVLPGGQIPKVLVFSDSIDSHEKLGLIEAATRNRITSTYGIGTWLTNDILLRDGSPVKPLNMVIKMTAASPDGHSPAVPCFKLTDSLSKRTGI